VKRLQLVDLGLAAGHSPDVFLQKPRPLPDLRSAIEDPAGR